MISCPCAELSKIDLFSSSFYYLFIPRPICRLFHDAVSPVDYIITSNGGVIGSYMEWSRHILIRCNVAAFAWSE